MIINDANLTDEYELFNISISSITNGHIIGNPGVATIVRTTGKYFIIYIIYDAYVHMYVLMYVDMYIRTYLHVYVLIKIQK